MCFRTHKVKYSAALGIDVGDEFKSQTLETLPL